jgi:hypothetical protein
MPELADGQLGIFGHLESQASGLTRKTVVVSKNDRCRDGNSRERQGRPDRVAQQQRLQEQEQKLDFGS